VSDSGPLAADEDIERGQPWAWIAWGLATALFFHGFFQRVAPSIMIDDLMREFAVSGVVLGNLSAFYFYAYAGLQIPVGVLLDYWGPRRLLTVSAVIGAVGSLLFATADSLPQAYFGRLLIGAGAGVCFISCLKIAMLWLPLRHFALLTGLVMCIGMIGGIGGQGPLAAVVDYVGWRGAVMWAALFSLVCGAGIWLVIGIGERSLRNTARERTRGRGSLGLMGGLRLVLTRSQTWLLALNLASHGAPMLAFAGLWGVAYIMTRYGLDRTSAAFITSMVLIGWAVGGVAGGWISDRIGRRKPIMVFAAVVAVVVWLIILFIPELSASIVAGLLLLNGLASGTMIVGFAVANETTPSTAGGTIAGVLNCGTMTSGAISQVLVGWLLDIGWDGRMADGVRVYSVKAFEDAFLVFVVCGLISLITVIFIRETYAKRTVE
jgi:MFS family permease